MAEEVIPHFREPDGKPMWAKEERLGKHTLTEHAATVGEPAIAPSIPWGENGRRIDPGSRTCPSSSTKLGPTGGRGRLEPRRAKPRELPRGSGSDL